MAAGEEEVVVECGKATKSDEIVAGKGSNDDLVWKREWVES